MGLERSHRGAVDGNSFRGPCFAQSAPEPRRRRRVVVCELRVAVIGGGLAGLSVCDRLLDGGTEVDLLDPNPVGRGNASAAAAGLLHKFTPRGRKAFMADEAYTRSTEFIRSCAPAAVIRRGPLVRPVVTDQQKRDFEKAGQLHPTELEFVGADRLKELLPETTASQALIIRDAMIVDTKLYLDCLWSRCTEKGATKHVPRTVTHTDALIEEGYDAVVVAAGHRSGELVPGGLPLQRKLGRNLTFRRQEGGPTLEHPVISGKYLVPLTEDWLLVGATVEPESDAASFEVDDTIEALGPRIFGLFPPLESHYEPDAVTHGVRGIPVRPSGTPPLPFLAPIAPNVWLFAGLASRGLLHHAVLADMLSEAILTRDPGVLPRQLGLENTP